ncbi:flavodoxin domain-containing protein [Amycolatopsis sp. 3B14]|uniref:flavodoxin domain-containing protein n=1 Tax=Amycolatopsis TaxID=1813 RepID=UPI003D969853
MRALVVYESMFGSTEEVARSVAKGLSGRMHVDVINVDDAPDEVTGVDLVVAGGPTHLHGLTGKRSRDAAAQQAGEQPLHSHKRGLREWLEGLATASPGTQAVTFDTRIEKPAWLTGSAARAAAKRLRRKGYRVSAAPESFFVTGKEAGDLHPGELERARMWGESLGDRADG